MVDEVPSARWIDDEPEIDVAPPLPSPEFDKEMARPEVLLEVKDVLGLRPFAVPVPDAGPPELGWTDRVREGDDEEGRWVVGGGVGVKGRS
jgi:hypothetical protein